MGDFDDVAIADVATQKMLGQRVFDVLFHRTAHRTCAILRIEALFHEELAGAVVERDVDVLLLEAGDDLGDLEIDDHIELLLLEHAEDDDIVETVEELGLEELLRGLGDLALDASIVGNVLLHGDEAEAALLFDLLRTDIRGEDDDGVTEVDLATKVVGHLAFFEDLQQEMHHIWVRFFDFVEQDHGIRATTHGFGKLTTFFITDIAGRRTDQTAGGVFLHVLGHVDLDQRIGGAKHEFGEVLREEGFADTSRAEEQERTNGAAWILQIGTGTTQSLADGDDRFVLADDLAFQLGFHLEQLLGFGLFHALKRNAGPFRDDGHDVVFGDIDDALLIVGAPALKHIVKTLLGVFLAITQVRGFFEVLFLDGAFFFDANLFDLGLDDLQFGRTRHGADAGLGTGLVHDVDGLVRQETGGQVTRTEVHGCFQGVFAVLRLVVQLVFAAQTKENLDGVLHGRFLDLHALEAAFERGVLLDVFAILVQRGRTDALQFASAECGFDDVAGVHRTFSTAGTNDGMQFVDEENDVLVPADFIHDRLDAFLKLTAILRACDHQCEVERDDTLVAQKFRHISRGNFLGETFNDSRLADAGFADENWIVFCATAEDLNHAGDFFRATDHWVHLAFDGEFGEIAAESFESRGLLVFLLVTCRCVATRGDGFSLLFLLFVLGREVRIEFLEDFAAGLVEVHIKITQHLGSDAFTFTQKAEQDVLRADVAVIEGLGFLGG